jgi:hypothetical protein
MPTRLAIAAPNSAVVRKQILGMSLGTTIELRLKNKQKMQGTRGPVSDSGFTLVDASAGKHQIAFDDVVSVKKFTTNSHATRNILIGVGIGVAGVAIVLAILVSQRPTGTVPIGF